MHVGVHVARGMLDYHRLPRELACARGWLDYNRLPRELARVLLVECLASARVGVHVGVHVCISVS